LTRGARSLPELASHVLDLTNCAVGKILDLLRELARISCRVSQFGGLLLRQGGLTLKLGSVGVRAGNEVPVIDVPGESSGFTASKRLAAARCNKLSMPATGAFELIMVRKDNRL
jgi:hypothetical protein